MSSTYPELDSPLISQTLPKLTADINELSLALSEAQDRLGLIQDILIDMDTRIKALEIAP